MNRTATLPIQTLPLLAPPKVHGWRVAGAAVQGVSHRRLDLPCQDAQGCQVLEDGALLVALADGAGSAPFSDLGAQCAVAAALDALSAGLESGLPAGTDEWERLLRDAFGAAREAVLRLAELQVEETLAAPRDYATTLTCAFASARSVWAGQIGDGMVVVEDEAGDLFAITRLQRGEYANETHFLTQDDALGQLVIDTFGRPASALAVMSDGLIRLALKMPAQEPHAPFFQPLFRFIEMTAEADAPGQLAAFLNSERVNSRTDDDKSLVLAVREGARVKTTIPLVESKEQMNASPGDERASPGQEDA